MINEDELLAELLEALARTGRVDAAATIEEAFRVASAAHKGQLRDGGAPYVVHPLRVARHTLEALGAVEPEVVVAALLHDAVEDSELTLAAVEERFGPRVATLVDHLTKPALAPELEGEARQAAKAERDARYYERLREGPPEALVVKAADRLDNLSEVLGARWSEAKKRRYAEEALETIAPLVAPVHPGAAAALEAAARDVLERLARGEGDVPDVGPHQDVEGAVGEEDSLWRRSRHLSFFARGEDYYLYHDLVGDIIQCHPKVLHFLDHFQEPTRERAAREHFKDEFLPGDLDAFFETLGQHLVLLREGEDDREVTQDWHPVRGPWIISYRRAKGDVTLCYKDRREGTIVTEQLPPLFGRLFELCDGSLKVREIVKRLSRQFPKEERLEERVRSTIRLWAHSQRQLLKLIPRNKSAYDMVGLPPYVLSTMPYPALRGAEEPPPEPAYDTREYHKSEITSAGEQFEERETTLSHALRVPHPALGGKTYGGALARALVDRDVAPEAPSATFRAVEVGGGTGIFAQCFLDGLALRAPRLFNRLRYTIVDIAPALRASQRERTRKHADRLRIVGGDAERLPLADASVDLMISNEVIADLAVSAVRRVDLEGTSGEDGGPGAEVVRRYALPFHDAPGLFFVNVGAFRLLEECARVLRPGGTAVLTEYGSHTRYPEHSTHLDHAEFSIHFGHLKLVAERLGFETSLEHVAQLVGLDPTVEVLHTTQTFFATLRAFLAQHGVALEKVAYTKDMFAELLGDRLALEHLQGLKFGPAGSRVLGLKPPEFKALIVRKPRSAGRAVTKVAVDF